MRPDRSAPFVGARPAWAGPWFGRTGFRLEVANDLPEGHGVAQLPTAAISLAARDRVLGARGRNRASGRSRAPRVRAAPHGHDVPARPVRPRRGARTPGRRSGLRAHRRAGRDPQRLPSRQRADGAVPPRRRRARPHGTRPPPRPLRGPGLGLSQRRRLRPDGRPVVRLWRRARRIGEMPDAAALGRARALVGYARLDRSIPARAPRVWPTPAC